MKKIIMVLILFGIIGCASAADTTNVTNIISGLCPEIIGGSNVVTLHPHYIDSWFSVYNAGHVTIQVYAYDYVGNHTPVYKNSFIGAIEPGQMGVLNNNASYYLYADYDRISDLNDPEKIKDTFNSLWIFIFIGIILLIVIVIILKKVFGR